MITTKSRFNRSTSLTVVDAAGNPTRRTYLDVWPRLSRVAFRDDGEIAVSGADNWSTLAAKALGDPDLWWVVADVNRVVDPWEALEALKETGGTLRTPNLVRTHFEHLSFGRNRLRR